MANNKISLDVELKAKIKESEKLFNEIDKRKGFSGKDGGEARNRILGSQTIINKYLDQVDLTRKEMLELNKAVRSLFRNLSIYSTKVEGLSKEAVKLAKQLEKAEDRERLVKDTLAERKNDASNKRVALMERLQGRELRAFTKSGTLSKTKLGADAIAKRIAAGQELGYTDANGQIVKVDRNTPEIGNLAVELNMANSELTSLKTEASECAEAVKRLTEQFNAQASKEGASLVQKVKSTGFDIEKGIGTAVTNYDDEQILNQEQGIINGKQKKDLSYFGKAFKQFTIYNIALKGVKTALREAVQTVKELDKELTEQAMVTGLTREQTYGLIKSYQDLALQVGATTKEVAGVATEYMKQGKTIQDSLILTEAAVSAAKVARVSVGDSVNYLTTALNGFQLSAEDAMAVSDKFAAVAAASATDYDELAIALSKVASQANLAGMSIDYTTALLTKGLETTREAPETMGTALKTIIARMRELGDYGETLEGDTDLNNVETQLSYVGIALRNNEGELRSTEEVLNELGMKWDTLDKNQQAAVAKALAGTRQQSRLIAMMSDYERVIELQEISQRSAGTTAAQASVYLEGVEASLNKINVAWEKIIMSVTDSEVIINFLSMAGGLLDHIGDFLSTDFGLVATLTTVSILGAATLGNKMREIELSKIKQQYDLMEQKAENEKYLLSQRKLVADKKSKIETINQLIKEKEILKAKKENVIKTAQIAKIKAEENGNTKLAAKYASIISKAEGEIKQTDLEINKLKSEDLKAAEEDLAKNEKILHYYEQQGENLKSQEGFINNISSGISNLKTPLITIIAMWKTISALLTAVRAKQEKNHKKTMIETAEETYAKSLASAGSIIKDLGVWGIPFAIAVVAALAGATLAIGSAASKAKSGTDGTVDSINQLSTEIYKLNEKANAIGKITSAFEDLDNKIIKTKSDLEEMNSLLEQGAETLSTETYKNAWKAKKAGEEFYGKGVSEQDFYNSLSDNDKIKFLQNKENSLKAQIDVYRKQQIASFNKLSDSQKAVVMDDNTTNSDYLKTQSAFRATATDNAYKYIDSLNLESKAIENVTVAIIDELSAWDALALAQNPSAVEEIVDSFKNLRVEGELVADILSSDDFDIIQKTKAFKEMEQALQGNTKALEAFRVEYNDYQIFAQMSEDVLNMIEYLDLSADEINSLFSNINKVLTKYGQDTISKEYFSETVMQVLSDTGNDIQKTIDYVFGSYLDSIEDYEDAYNEIVNSFSQAIAIGALNMGQNTEKLANQINNFYSKASEWSEMSESDKTEFINSNAALFKGEDGAGLYAAFESGDCKKIEQALRNNKALSDNIARTIEEIDRDLSIEMAKTESERNTAYIKYLQEWKEKLQDQTNIFRADLELLLNQEKEQLDIYKDFLQKQQDELEDSLDKRKEAYEKYFEAINQQQEDEDYQEQSNLLIANLAKLSASTDAASNRQRADLQQQLEDLEKQRQQELRQRAQEALIDSIDSSVEEISNNIKKLLDNEQLLLQAMTGDIANGNNFLTSLLASARQGGMTNLQLEDYANQIASAFGSILDTSGIGEILQQVQNNATVNVGNKTYDLNTEDGNALWQVLSAIMLKNGYGN